MCTWLACLQARAAVKKGFAVLVDDVEAAIKVSDSIAPGSPQGGRDEG